MSALQYFRDAARPPEPLLSDEEIVRGFRVHRLEHLLACCSRRDYLVHDAICLCGCARATFCNSCHVLLHLEPLEDELCPRGLAHLELFRLAEEDA